MRINIESLLRPPVGPGSLPKDHCTRNKTKAVINIDENGVNMD